MSVHAQICNVILQLLLFGLILYKTFDLARAYIFPWLREEMRSEDRTHFELIEKDRYLNTAQKNVMHQIEDQKRFFDILEKNAQAVEHALFEKRAQQRLEQEAINKKITLKRTQQMTNIELAKQLDTTFEQALSLAHSDLLHHFVEKHDAHHLDKIIDALPQKQHH